MNKVVCAIILSLFMAGFSYAQVLTLNSPEVLSVPTAVKLDLRKIIIDVEGQSVLVHYRFLDSDNNPIQLIGSKGIEREWRCTNNGGATCFTDTFSFAIRSQDVGVAIGKGLRALIWSKMRQSVLSAGNNAELP